MASAKLAVEAASAAYLRMACRSFGRELYFFLLKQISKNYMAWWYEPM